MLFNSYVFILVFLPLFLAGWYGLNKWNKYKLAQVFLIVMSLVFYGYENYYYVFLIVTSIAINYCMACLISGIRKRGKRNNSILWIGIVANLSILGYFKYANFFLANFQRISDIEVTFLNIALPLGISFYTFQQIGYLVDCSKGESEAYSLIDYASFVVFFPQLIAGPIVSHNQLIPQFQDCSRRTYNSESFAIGSRLFIAGLAKKVLVADFLGRTVDTAFEMISGLGTLSVILVSISYTMQIFLDFSGYSDMAMGLGYMIGIELPINFDQPYRASSVQEFWKKWHITLNQFFTKYVYIPLGGSRCSTGRNIFNILVTFLLSGLWHGADWAFVLWGLLHGLMVVFSRFTKRLPVWAGTAITFVFVNFAWLLFRAGEFKKAGDIFWRLTCWDGFGNIPYIVGKLDGSYFYLIGKAFGAVGISETMYLTGFWILLLLVAFCIAFAKKNTYVWAKEGRLSKKNAFLLAFLLFLCVINFGGVTKFLYFNF